MKIEVKNLSFSGSLFDFRYKIFPSVDIGHKSEFEMMSDKQIIFPCRIQIIFNAECFTRSQST
jgi:hypothetical protein